jgi:hypothetical protein
VNRGTGVNEYAIVSATFNIGTLSLNRSVAKLPDSVISKLELIMSNNFKIPDPATRARDIVNLREAGRLLDLCTLELDETIAALDKHLLQQRRARLLSKSNPLPAGRIES